MEIDIKTLATLVDQQITMKMGRFIEYYKAGELGKAVNAPQERMEEIINELESIVIELLPVECMVKSRFPEYYRAFSVLKSRRNHIH
jgi:hypothetical protein